MATAHVLCGFLGSGKTTVALELEQQHQAVRFTPDEWMARLFGADPPAELFDEKASTILDLLKPVWTRCLCLGVDVVLDYGFWRRADRDDVRNAVQECGGDEIFYSVECPEAEARRRVDARNRHARSSLYIAPQTYDFLKLRFEPMQADERYVVATPMVR